MIPYLGISALLCSYRSGALHPRDVIHAAWQRAAEGDPAIWISRPDWHVVEAMIEELEKKDPATLPLYGIPFSIKDNIDWDELPTTAACPAFSYKPDKSAFVVEELIKAGAIPMGKTNLDQFATGLVGVRTPYGIAKNAFDEKYVPGGSSSGAAVSVALGMCSFALGTDTAGSGRVPASLNNLVGLKPTRGVLSNSGLVPACRTLDCISIFALTACDATTIFDVVEKFDPADAYARKAEFKPGKTLEQLVIGVPRATQLEFFGNQSAAKVFNASIEKFKSLGWQIKEVDLQPFLDAALLLYEGPWVAERFAGCEELIKEQPEAFYPVTLQIIGGGDKANAVAAFRAQYKLAELRRQSEAAWEEVDVIITPTAGTHYTVEEVLAEPIKLNSNLGRYTNYMNLLDMAAIAVPAGFLEDTCMPWGITLFAPAFSDRMLAGLAARFHQSLAIRLGKSAVTSDEAPLPQDVKVATDMMQIAVCGAHMEGLPLNPQLLERGGLLLKKTRSAPVYRMFHLPPLIAGKPARPGMVRVGSDGVSLEMEVWAVPTETVGSFLQGIAAPLGLGKVKLEDGSEVCGFICEGHVAETAQDISSYGGWRNWLKESQS